MAAAKEILNLLDFFWFEHEILSSNSKPFVSSSVSSSCSSTHKPVQEEDHKEHPKIEEERPNLPEIAVFQIRSFSERCLRCNVFSPDASSSPKSVISAPMSDFSESVEGQSMKKKVSSKRRRRKNREKRRRISRSFSELEHEELKGFMDLGFVFTEEDKSSSLVSILPGLQKWGQNSSRSEGDEEPIKNRVKNRVSSRPYLSEAWDVYNQRKVNKNPMVNWTFPPTCNENNMKLRLKAWAHVVASSIR